MNKSYPRYQSICYSNASKFWFYCIRTSFIASMLLMEHEILSSLVDRFFLILLAVQPKFRGICVNHRYFDICYELVACMTCFVFWIGCCVLLPVYCFCNISADIFFLFSSLHLISIFTWIATGIIRCTNTVDCWRMLKIRLSSGRLVQFFTGRSLSSGWPKQICTGIQKLRRVDR